MSDRPKNLIFLEKLVDTLVFIGCGFIAFGT